MSLRLSNLSLLNDELAVKCQLLSFSAFYISARFTAEQHRLWCGMTLTEGALRLQIMVNGVLDNSARIINSYQVCSSWVHILDAVPWPGTTPSQNAIPRPHPRRQIPRWPAAQLPHCQNTLVSSLTPPVPFHPKSLSESSVKACMPSVQSCIQRRVVGCASRPACRASSN